MLTHLQPLQAHIFSCVLEIEQPVFGGTSHKTVGRKGLVGSHFNEVSMRREGSSLSKWGDAQIALDPYISSAGRTAAHGCCSSSPFIEDSREMTSRSISSSVVIYPLAPPNLQKTQQIRPNTQLLKVRILVSCVSPCIAFHASMRLPPSIQRVRRH